jgi:hypothetical protein
MPFAFAKATPASLGALAAALHAPSSSRLNFVQRSIHYRAWRLAFKLKSSSKCRESFCVTEIEF